jgi:thiol-disulfide isomerase/thioredoxin
MRNLVAPWGVEQWALAMWDGRAQDVVLFNTPIPLSPAVASDLSVEHNTFRFVERGPSRDRSVHTGERPMRRWFPVLVLMVIPCAAAAGADRPAVGTKVETVEFKDIRFLPRSLDDFGSKKAIVVIAVTNSCPLVQRYLPVLAELEKSYRDRGVQFLALNVSADDPIREIAAQAVESGCEFPFGRDVDGQAARAFGFQRTPEVVVLGADHTIRYRGRIDDQFRTGGGKPSPSSEPLKAAIEDVLADRDVAIRETTVDGCLVPSRASIASKESPPNYAEHIAPLLQRHCQDCHHAGTEAPFGLMNYRDVATQSEAIREVVTDRSMPPWFASERHGTWINRRGFSDAERETFLAWFAAGMPKGDLAKQPAARVFHDAKWKIGEPDLILKMPIPHQIPATGFVDYRYTVFPHIFAEDTWVDAVEILPENGRVVHHANLAFMKIGEKASEEGFITGRVPGGDAMVMDPGTGYLIPKGSVVALQIH